MPGRIRDIPSPGVQPFWSEYFDRITDGIAVERQVKGWSRSKKEANSLRLDKFERALTASRR
jgi:putative endonuclease